MDLLIQVGLGLLLPVGYAAVGFGAAYLLRSRSLARFGRDKDSLDPAEQSGLMRLCGIVVVLWLPLALVLALTKVGNLADRNLISVFANRCQPHFSEELDAPPWQCVMARGRIRDDVKKLEDTYVVALNADAGPYVEPNGTALWAEFHTNACPWCGIPIWRTALVARSADEQDTRTIIKATAWLPQEHDQIWEIRTDGAQRRARQLLASSS